MVHKNLERSEASVTTFNLLNENIKRQGTTIMVIPCLCSFTVRLLR